VTPSGVVRGRVMGHPGLVMQDLGDRRKGKGQGFGNPQCRTPKLLANALLLVTIVSKAWSSATTLQPNSLAATRKTAASSNARVRAASVAGLLAAIASVAAGCFLIPNLLPIADVDVDKTDGIAPLTIQFDGMGSFDPDGAIRRTGGTSATGTKVSGLRSSTPTWMPALSRPPSP